MMYLARKIKAFAADTSGAAIVEYGLALLVVAGIAIAAFGGLATVTNTNTQSACTAVDATC